MATAPKNWENQMVTLDGTTQTVGEWCRQRGLKPANVYNRKRHSTWAEALEKPEKASKRWRMVI